MFGTARTNKWYVPLIIILVSAALFFIYYIFYVSWQRNYANERAFRLLSVLGDQVESRFVNLKKVFAASLVSSGDVTEYLARVARFKPEEVSVIDSDSNCPPEWKRTGDLRLQLLENPAAFTLQADFTTSMADMGHPENCRVSAKVKPGLTLRERFHNLTADYFDDILLATSEG